MACKPKILDGRPRFLSVHETNEPSVFWDDVSNKFFKIVEYDCNRGHVWTDFTFTHCVKCGLVSKSSGL